VLFTWDPKGKSRDMRPMQIFMLHGDTFYGMRYPWPEHFQPLVKECKKANIGINEQFFPRFLVQEIIKRDLIMEPSRMCFYLCVLVHIRLLRSKTSKTSKKQYVANNLFGAKVCEYVFKKL